MKFRFYPIYIQDRFKDWESSGVSIIQVLSQPDGKWDGERGYVQVMSPPPPFLLTAHAVVYSCYVMEYLRG